MSESELQTALLVIQDLALLITIIGWIYTGGQQRSLLRETRRYQRMDRDLSAYRARMDKASELTASLVTSSDWWYKLAALAKATLDENKPREFFASGLRLIAEAARTKLQLAVILYDPQFRTLRDLLPENVAKEVYDSLKSSASRVQAFHEQTYDMEPTDPDLEQRLDTVYREGKEIGDTLVAVADKFADAFAFLDRTLTQES